MKSLALPDLTHDFFTADADTTVCRSLKPLQLTLPQLILTEG
jgi:hypothetical protein